MKLLLQEPIIWNIIQKIFGADDQKQKLYRSMVKNKGKLLDFGCADGNTFMAFKKFDYTGVDIDPKAIDYASNKYSTFPSAKFICTDIIKNTLPKESYDTVLFAGTGHHIPDQLMFKIIKSLSRLLKTGGSLIIIDTIKDESRKSKLLSILMSMDQGKYYKDENFYNNNLRLFSKNLVPVSHKKHYIVGTFMPQPTYYIIKFSKI